MRSTGVSASGGTAALPETQSKMSLSRAAQQAFVLVEFGGVKGRRYGRARIGQGECRSPCCRDRRCDRANACAASQLASSLIFSPAASKRGVAYRRRRWPSHAAPKRAQHTDRCARRASRPFSPKSTSLPGIGPRLGKLVERLAGPLVVDLLWHLPFAVIDRRNAPEVAQRRAGRGRHPHRHGRRAPSAAQSAPALSRLVQRRDRPALPHLSSTAARIISRSCCRWAKYAWSAARSSSTRARCR